MSLEFVQHIIDDALNGSVVAARLLEDEIKRRGLQERYIYELERIIVSRDHWEYIRATPEQRAQAFVKVAS
jgi:hypothetical protein